MKSKNLFIGVIIIFIGVVALLNSLNVIDFSWRVVWHLWPMLLVITGIAMLPVKEWLKTILLLVALAVGVLLYQNEAEKQSRRFEWSQWTNHLPIWEWWDEVF